MTDRKLPFDSAKRRFVWRSTLAILAFALIYTLAGWRFANPPPSVGALIVVATCIPLVYWAHTYLQLMRSKDEFQNLLLVQAAAISAGAALLVGAVWGVAEVFLGFAHLNPALLLPVAAVANSTAFVILMRRYK